MGFGLGSLFRVDAPSLCFRGGALRLLSSLVAFLASCIAPDCLSGHWPFW